MNRPGASWCNDKRGVAAVEFAIVAPLMLIFLGGITDFGLLTASRSQLANGIAQGVQYALLQGPGATATIVSAMVRTGSTRAGLGPAVTVVVSGPACYCVTTTPALLVMPATALSATLTCPGTCPAPAAPPGTFVIITASYVYQSLMPYYSQLANPTISQTVTVRLQ
ncbi:MAG: hypothetical protein QOH05_4911 [Acetobacteraceae bacterium]|jgi:Flp pilus assembly protein TadG|nr:hypothetical protein [Acetobacteraceae bacterium]